MAIFRHIEQGLAPSHQGGQINICIMTLVKARSYQQFLLACFLAASILLCGDVEENPGPRQVQTRLQVNNEQEQQTVLRDADILRQVLQQMKKLDTLDEINTKLDNLMQKYRK